jgi:hypothetical protein
MIASLQEAGLTSRRSSRTVFQKMYVRRTTVWSPVWIGISDAGRGAWVLPGRSGRPWARSATATVSGCEPFNVIAMVAPDAGALK